MLIRAYRHDLACEGSSKKKPDGFLFFFFQNREQLLLPVKLSLNSRTYIYIYIYINWMHYQPMEFIVHSLTFIWTAKLIVQKYVTERKEMKCLKKKWNFFLLISPCLALLSSFPLLPFLLSLSLSLSFSRFSSFSFSFPLFLSLFHLSTIVNTYYKENFPRDMMKSYAKEYTFPSVLLDIFL